MKRQVFFAISALSLLLCIATATMWIRSYCVFDGYSNDGEFENLSAPHSAIAVKSQSGLLRLCYCEFTGGQGPGIGAPKWMHSTAPQLLLPGISLPLWNHGGFGVLRGLTLFSDFIPHNYWILGKMTVWFIPYWAILLCTSVFPVVATLQIIHEWRTHRRRSRQQCPACGYDLRATPDRCPECGTVTQNR